MMQSEVKCHCYSCFLKEAKKPRSSDYWRTRDGMSRRAHMIGEGFTFKIINNSLIAFGSQNGVVGFEWVGNLDERTCIICDSGIGRRFRLGQFLPSIPAHANCRCEWNLLKSW